MQAVSYASMEISLPELMIMVRTCRPFMVEVLKCEQPLWRQSADRRGIKQNFFKLKPYVDVKFECGQKNLVKVPVPWFFGRNGTDPIPVWTGYTLGWRIVENYLKIHPQERASSLVLKPTDEILKSTT